MKIQRRLFIDACFVLLSVIAAYVMSQYDIASYLIAVSQGSEVLAIFIAGLAFVSIFTIVPAIVVLGQFSVEYSLPMVVLFGSLGALTMDYLIFKLFRDRVGKDAKALCQVSSHKRLFAVCNLRMSRWMLAFLGGIVIASPLPDEIGLALMGLGGVPTKAFLPISFFFNALGILLIALVARSL